MNHRKRFFTVTLFASLALFSNRISAAAITREQIIAEADKVADAQLKAIGDKADIDWTWAVMDAGYSEFLHVSPRGSDYTKALTVMADKVQWTALYHEKAPFHADDFCIGQAWLDLYAANSDPAKLKPLRERLDSMVDHLNTSKDAPKLTFWWCDALFMAPPVLCRMSAITGDRKYIEAMDKEYWRTVAALYDKDEHLFYRDARFVHRLDDDNKKIFWSRGNGWVLGGLARVLEYMPTDYPSRPKYETLFKEMSAKLITLRRSDGTWGSSLLDSKEFDQPETSGTSLFTYGLAWGINHKLLNRGVYLPVVSKAWTAMISDCREDGLPGYSQSANSQPAAVKPEGTQVYTTGGYLLAATELQRLAPLPDAPTHKLQGANAGGVPILANAAATTQPATDSKCFARYVPERMDDIAWENDRIAHRIYGPALQHNPKEHSGSGIDVWVKSVRYPVINEWYKSDKYHVDRGTGLDFYEVGLSCGDGGLGIWGSGDNGGQLYNSKDWVEQKILDRGPNECGFTIRYDPWDANGRKVWEHRTETLKAGSNLDKIESAIDSDKPGEIIIGIGLAKRDGKGGKLFQDKALGIMSYWQPPEKDGTIGVGVKVDPASLVGFDEDKLNYLVLVKETAGKPFVYYAGACWDKGLDFHSAEEWERYLKEFKE